MVVGLSFALPCSSTRSIYERAYRKHAAEHPVYRASRCMYADRHREGACLPANVAPLLAHLRAATPADVIDEPADAGRHVSGGTREETLIREFSKFNGDESSSMRRPLNSHVNALLV